MVERTIRIDALQKAFTVGVRDAYKQKRNRSFSNASNCCGAKVKQKKLCSVCDGDVEVKECNRKIVKIGKEEHLMNADALKQITSNLAGQMEMNVHTFVEQLPTEAVDKFDSLAYLIPAKKKEGEYVELREVLKGRIGIGKAVFRGNEYEIVLTVGDDGMIRLRKMVEQGQLYDVPSVDVDAPMNSEIIELERQIVSKTTKDSYDFSTFRDTRAEAEEQMIEDVVLHGKQPDVQTVQKVVQKSDNDELARLKELME